MGLSAIIINISHILNSTFVPSNFSELEFQLLTVVTWEIQFLTLETIHRAANLQCSVCPWSLFAVIAKQTLIGNCNHSKV